MNSRSFGDRQIQFAASDYNVEHIWRLMKSRLSRIFFAGMFCYLGAGVTESAFAATARLKWLPPSSGTVASYRVYVRTSQSSYGSSSQWTGNPAAAPDGSISADVSFTPAPSGINYFAVTAVSATNNETALSQERYLGSPNPCRIDSCGPRQAVISAPNPTGRRVTTPHSAMARRFARRACVTRPPRGIAPTASAVQ